MYCAFFWITRDFVYIHSYLRFLVHILCKLPFSEIASIHVFDKESNRLIDGKLIFVETNRFHHYMISKKDQ